MSMSPHIVVQPNRPQWTQAVEGPGRTSYAQGKEPRTAGTMPATSSEGGGFMDFLRGIVDIINPLQHIPVVSTFYRRITGDEISPMARVVGGTVFGGPLGAGLAVADVAFAQASGATAGDTIMQAFAGNPHQGAGAPSSSPSADAVQLASLQTPSLSAFPTPDRTRTASGVPTASSGPDTRLMQQPMVEQTMTAVRHNGRSSPAQHLTMLAAADASPSLPEAPADSRMEIPPELMALKMKEGLDKYAAMKSRGL